MNRIVRTVLIGLWLAVCERVPAFARVELPVPRVLALSDHDARIAWETVDAQVGRLRWWREDDGVVHTVGAGVGWRHRVPLERLAAGKEYGYQVADKQQWSERRRFRVFESGYRQRLRFAVIGDSGSGSAHQWAIARRLDAWKPDFVLHVGDVVYENGAQEGYPTRYVAPYRTLIGRVPVYPALGNHDWVSQQGGPLLRFFGLEDEAGRPRYWYEKRLGELQLLACDSNQALHPGSVQYRWLEERLREPWARWRLLYWHHPLYSGGLHGGSAALRTHVQPLLDRYRVQLVFQGHDHHYERSQPIRTGRVDPAGTTYIVTGGAGAWLRPVKGGKLTARAFSAYHFVGVVLDREQLNGAVYDEEGRVRDAFSVEREILR